MVLGGRALVDGRTAARRLRDVARSCGALALSLLAVAYATLAGAATASAARLPPVQISYSGKMSIEVFPTAGKPAHQLRALSWTASSSSAGSDGGLALDFSSVGGSASTEGNGDCYDSTSALSLATARNPRTGDRWRAEDAHPRGHPQHELGPSAQAAFSQVTAVRNPIPSN